MRDKILRVKQIAQKGDPFKGYDFKKEEEPETQTLYSTIATSLLK